MAIMHPGLGILYAIFAWCVIFLILLLADKISDEEWYQKLLGWFFNITTALAILFAIVSLATWIFVPSNTTTEVTECKEEDIGIIALYEGNHYLYQTPEGIKQDVAPVKQTTIHYTDGEATLHKTSKTTVTRTTWWWCYQWAPSQEEITYDFYVPKEYLND